jgi:pimeloyl-ACP methyl ester carboxylesterase
MLEPLMARLRTERPLLALDTLGNGDSSPPDVAEPDIGYFAAAAREVLDALDVSHCCLYGTHTGAHIAVELAVTDPQMYSAIIIDGMGLYSPNEAADFRSRYVPGIEPADDGSQLWWAWHFVRNGYLFFPWFETDVAHRTNASLPPADFLHAKVVEVLKALGSYRHSYLAAFRYPKRERLAQLSIPALVTTGTQDVLAPYFDELVAAVPGARGELIDSSSLMAHADLLAEIVDDFLASAPGRPDRGGS